MREGVNVTTTPDSDLYAPVNSQNAPELTLNMRPEETAMIEGYSEAMAGTPVHADPDPLAGLGPRALEEFEKDYKASAHRRTRTSKKDFAAGWVTAMEKHGGVIWRTLNRQVTG
jgi:hypothetical protein